MILGFTDHDRNLVVNGTTCKASSGMQASEAASELGLSVDSQDVEGALADETITDRDITAGRYDGARVEVWMVNWADPNQSHHLRTAMIGEISQEDSYFKAELRGLTALLDQTSGRTFSRDCDAILGDSRCGADLTKPGYTGSSEVVEVLDRLTLRGTGLEGFASNWFAYGSLVWTTGVNAGLSAELSGSQSAEDDVIKLWQAMPELPTPGDQFVLTAGCDKSFGTCRSKFANGLNFRGCPHMPGTDFALSYASGGDLYDGSPLVK